MNRWRQIRRMRGAAFLILIGVLALLNQWHILRWDQSWPFFLIVPGLLALAERAAWTADVREQQAAQGLGVPSGPVMGTMDAEQSYPSQSGAPSYWSTASPSVEEKPFIQPHPPVPEESGREDR